MPKRLTLCEFISRSSEAHDGFYSYEHSIYRNNSSPLAITCPDHGIFFQVPMSHLAGQGCAECGKERKAALKTKTTDQFIQSAISVHGDRYSYEKSFYVRTDKKLEITCRIHGPFLMTPNAHTNGQGCTRCADEFNAKKRMKPFSEFLAQASAAHDSKYKYTESTYAGDSKKLEVICFEHGSFRQSPNSHLKGRGCPKCSVSGFDVEKPAHLYLLESDCGAYIKVGIANKLRDRQTKLRKQTPFKFKVIHTFESDGYEISGLEKYYHSKLESCGFRCFDGATEWFKIDRDVVDEIRALQPDSATRQPQENSFPFSLT